VYQKLSFVTLLFFFVNKNPVGKIKSHGTVRTSRGCSVNSPHYFFSPRYAGTEMTNVCKFTNSQKIIFPLHPFTCRVNEVDFRDTLLRVVGSRGVMMLEESPNDRVSRGDP
jgi:hypothetical protein